MSALKCACFLLHIISHHASWDLYSLACSSSSFYFFYGVDLSLGWWCQNIQRILGIVFPEACRQTAVLLKFLPLRSMLPSFTLLRVKTNFYMVTASKSLSKTFVFLRTKFWFSFIPNGVVGNRVDKWRRLLSVDLLQTDLMILISQSTAF